MITHQIFHRDDIKLDGTCRLRNAVRAVILDGRDIVMAYLKNSDEYKFPGGDVEEGEDHLEALKTNKRNIGSKNGRVTKWMIRETYMLERIRELYVT